MGHLIENRPISCTTCGQNPVMGRESIMEHRGQKIMEVRWVCHNCGTLLRVDEADLNEAK